MPYLRLITRRQRWGLTLQGWGVLVLSVGVLSVLFINSIHTFLAPYHPVKCDVLVVEGWVNDHALKEAMQAFADHACDLLVSTGTPILQGSRLSPYGNYAKVGALSLQRLGFDACRMRVVPSPLVKKDRTYASALAFKQWLRQAEVEVQSLNLFSEGPHARRSWLLYEKALGDEIDVGVIAGQVVHYDPKRWWKSSNGIRTVIDEAIAYVYARVFFYPND